jgi:hypothetical protein
VKTCCCHAAHHNTDGISCRSHDCWKLHDYRCPGRFGDCCGRLWRQSCPGSCCRRPQRRTRCCGRQPLPQLRCSPAVWPCCLYVVQCRWGCCCCCCSSCYTNVPHAMHIVPACPSSPLSNTIPRPPVPTLQVAGRFVKNGKVLRASRRAEDIAVAERLWRISCELTGAEDR